MKLLCLTDPTTHPSFDTTVHLYSSFALHAEIEFTHGDSHSLGKSGEVSTIPVDKELSYEEFLSLSQNTVTRTQLGDYDLVFCRTDKPRPAGYHQILSAAENVVKFVNSPSGLDKIDREEFANPAFEEFLPDHIFSRDVEEINEFFARFGVVVAKQSNSYGGKAVYKLWQEGGSYYFDNIVQGTKEFQQFDQLLAFLFKLDTEPYQFTRFLVNISEGDKRVLVVDGEVYGGYLRKSLDDHWVHNITTGGTSHPSDVGEREREVIAATCNSFHELGVYTLGYDFLMDNDGSWILSEINSGNIGGYNRLEDLSGQPVCSQLISWLLTLVKS